MLIAIGSVLNYQLQAASQLQAEVQPPAEPVPPSPLVRLLIGVGDKNVAIAIGTVLAMLLLRFVEPGRRSTLVARSLSAAGSIILLTSAGGVPRNAQAGWHCHRCGGHSPRRAVGTTVADRLSCHGVDSDLTRQCANEQR